MSNWHWNHVGVGYQLLQIWDILDLGVDEDRLISLLCELTLDFESPQVAQGRQVVRVIVSDQTNPFWKLIERVLVVQHQLLDSTWVAIL